MSDPVNILAVNRNSARAFLKYKKQNSPCYHLSKELKITQNCKQVIQLQYGKNLFGKKSENLIFFHVSLFIKLKLQQILSKISFGAKSRRTQKISKSLFVHFSLFLDRFCLFANF